MKIQRVRLKNGYKRFHDLTIDLGDNPKRIVALVGPNGCGKSSVLDGLMFHNNSHRVVGNKGTKNHEYHSMDGVPNYTYQNVEIQFTSGSFSEVYARKSEIGKEGTIFSFRSPYRYNSHVKISQVQAVGDIRLNAYGASTAADLDDKMEENYRRLNVMFNKYLKENDCRPSEAKNEIISELNKSLKSCLELEIASIGDVEAGQGTLYFRKPDHPREFEFNVLSSGEKEVVDILLDIYLRKEEYSDSVFMLDEPELHINTSIQKRLLVEINRLVGVDCQIWITTHSIGFMRALQEEYKDECQIIRFEQGKSYAAEKHHLAPIEACASVWRELFEVALDDLVQLVCPRRIVYCEGRGEPGKGGVERGFDAKVFNRIFASEFPDTLFVSSGGNTELDQRSKIAIAILSKALPAVEVLILKDRDMASGKFTTQIDRGEYLKKNGNSHRLLDRWEIENYLFDPEILRKYCQKKECQFNEEQYSAMINSVVDDNVKDQANQIKSICGVSENYGTEKFKIELAEMISSDTSVYKEMKTCIFLG